MSRKKFFLCDELGEITIGDLYKAHDLANSLDKEISLIELDGNGEVTGVVRPESEDR